MNYKKNTESPDDVAQVRLAHTMSTFAGKFHGSSYPAERMTKLVCVERICMAVHLWHHSCPSACLLFFSVAHSALIPTRSYPVDGGMEDWGYAASWDTKYVFDCEAGTKYGGYSKERQRARHNNASFRVFNVLVSIDPVNTQCLPCVVLEPTQTDIVPLFPSAVS